MSGHEHNGEHGPAIQPVGVAVVARPVVDLDKVQRLISVGLSSFHPESRIENGALIVHVPAKDIHAALETLFSDPNLQFNVMTHLTAVDLLPLGPGPMASQAIDAGTDVYAKLMQERIAKGEPRFAVVYELFSTVFKHRVRVKCFLADTGRDDVLPEIDSVADVYLTANWHERETYDLFGIRFRGHPDPRRILLPDRWDGFPLRKEYPFDGKRSWSVGTTVVDSVEADSHLGL